LKLPWASDFKMRKLFWHIIGLCCIWIVTGCGISDDCWKGNGRRIYQTFPLENFTKIKVYEGIGLVVKEGPNYEVKIAAPSSILDNIEVKMDGSMLVVKDRSTCNLARDYGQTIVYVTTPFLEEIHSKTEQDILSDGVLTFPELRLYSVDISDGAGTGDFRLKLDSEIVYIESNNVSNFYVSGETNRLIVFFSWGNGIFKGEQLHSNYIDVYHRGSNNMTFFPIQSIVGNLYSTGDIVLKNRPILPPNVIQHFTGRLIIE
jgi:hypothetical protein